MLERDYIRMNTAQGAPQLMEDLPKLGGKRYCTICIENRDQVKNMLNDLGWSFAFKGELPDSVA